MTRYEIYNVSKQYQQGLVVVQIRKNTILTVSSSSINSVVRVVCMWLACYTSGLTMPISFRSIYFSLAASELYMYEKCMKQQYRTIDSGFHSLQVISVYSSSSFSSSSSPSSLHCDSRSSRLSVCETSLRVRMLIFVR